MPLGQRRARRIREWIARIDIDDSRVRYAEYWTGFAVGYYTAQGGKFDAGDYPTDKVMWLHAIQEASHSAAKRFPYLPEPSATDRNSHARKFVDLGLAL